jgi:hypothetical protein
MKKMSILNINKKKNTSDFSFSDSDYEVTDTDANESESSTGDSETVSKQLAWSYLSGPWRKQNYPCAKY